MAMNSFLAMTLATSLVGTVFMAVAYLLIRGQLKQPKKKPEASQRSEKPFNKQ
jgi:hypothetical protein